MTFVCAGFWLAVLFQFFYYRFLHPSTHVRLSMKQHLSSMVHIRRLNKSKSCEEMIGQNDLQNIHENNELIETRSLHLDRSNDERWHNRFSFANRQKLISQQQAIDQKVKLTRLEEEATAAKRQHQTISRRFLTRISTTLKRPTTISTSLVTQSLDESNLNQKEDSPERSSVIFAPIKRISHHQQSKMYDIDEDTQLNEEALSSNQEFIRIPLSNSTPTIHTH